MKKFNLVEILRIYGIDPDVCTITEFKRGHINDSFIIEVHSKCYFFLQRINHNVFKDPESLMENLLKVDHAMMKHYGDRETNPYPAVQRNRNKKFFHQDKAGNFWRLMEYVPNSRSFNIAEDTTTARKGAAAFGRFQHIMNGETAADYMPTIPDFHHLGKRLGQLQDAIAKDSAGRVKEARNEITFALDRLEYADKLESLLRKKIVPIRVTHNDTKLNNVLFNDKEVKYICVVDLDTVMPGSVLYDYGDMVRTFTSPVEEDEPDPEKVIFREDIFEALTQGYLSEIKQSLQQGEKDNILFGAKVMLLMIGVRFLTDFLEGDHYFKTSRENHNLDRCRNQFVLLKQLEKRESALQDIIRRIL
jgi:hypothetical protein